MKLISYEVEFIWDFILNLFSTWPNDLSALAGSLLSFVYWLHNELNLLIFIKLLYNIELHMISSGEQTIFDIPLNSELAKKY